MQLSSSKYRRCAQCRNNSSDPDVKRRAPRQKVCTDRGQAAGFLAKVQFEYCHSRHNVCHRRHKKTGVSFKQAAWWFGDSGERSKRRDPICACPLKVLTLGAMSFHSSKAWSRAGRAALVSALLCCTPRTTRTSRVSWPFNSNE